MKNCWPFRSPLHWLKVALLVLTLGVAWSQDRPEIGRFAARDASSIDGFGLSTAISGCTIVVGSYLDDDNGPDSGSAYVFVSAGGTWSQQAKLLASDGTAFDCYGAVDM